MYCVFFHNKYPYNTILPAYVKILILNTMLFFEVQNYPNNGGNIQTIRVKIMPVCIQ